MDNSRIDNKGRAQEILNDMKQIDFTHTKYAVYRNEWISVKNQLPINKDIVLVINNEQEMSVCKFEATEWNYFFMLYNTSYQVTKVTHWQRLPEAPKESE